MWGNNSSNTALSADPENGGAGFQSWTSQEEYSLGNENNCGFYTTIPEFFNPGEGNLMFPQLSAIDGSCFAMYAHSGTKAYARRKMKMPLSVGGFIEVSLGIAYRSGKKGVRFIDNTSTPPVTTFSFYASDSDGGYILYTLEHGTKICTSIPYTPNSTFDIRLDSDPFSIFKGLFLSYRINDTNNESEFLSDTIKADEIEFFIENTDNGSNINNLYFNILTGYSAYR